MPSIAAPASSEPYRDDTPLVARTVASPIGALRLVTSERGLRAILWPGERPGRVPLGSTSEGDSPILREAATQIAAYFAGHLRRFAVPLDALGTPFQHEVWAALATIPFGETRTYGEIAVAIGRPTAARAVGAANGRNPLSIVVPCHRVVGAGGGLTGFAGGLEIKRHLLALESGERRLL